MTQPICGVNASCYEPSPEASSAPATGGGGAPASNATTGSEGAGNVEKNAEPEASLRCLPQVILAAHDCGKALLLRSLTGALVCGMRLDALRDCLKSEPKE